jgi:predicted GNAT superfamily acetyltransferase
MLPGDRGNDQQVREVAEEARRTAAAAARRAGVEIRELHALEELQSASALLDQTWASAAGSAMPAALLRAFAHTGSHVSGARSGGRLVGAVLGFLGFYEGKLSLHSHMLAVLPESQDRSVGYALKLHQRAWALDHGILRVTWTFDPLVSRNCYLNLTRLGVHAAEYLPNFYGTMDDVINAADQSDRLLGVWRLTGSRAVAAIAGRFTDESDILERGDHGVVLDIGPLGQPLAAHSRQPVLLCHVPADIQAIRRRDPGLALEWRFALRHSMQRAMADGYQVETFLRTGCFVLHRTAAGGQG